MQPLEKADVDPDLYVQRKTGRALTRLVAIIAGLQLGGVFLWVGLFFVGVVDATENLNEFLISQFGVFFLSLVVGLWWIISYIRRINEEAENL